MYSCVFFVGKWKALRRQFDLVALGIEKWKALRRQFDLVALGIVKWIAGNNPLYFLTTLVCIRGGTDNWWVIELSNCPVVKE